MKLKSHQIERNEKGKLFYSESDATQQKKTCLNMNQCKQLTAILICQKFQHIKVCVCLFDFRSLSRKSDSPKKAPPPLDNDDDDGSTCSICLDTWESKGDHRLVSLKCGHLFGDSCIKRYAGYLIRKSNGLDEIIRINFIDKYICDFQMDTRVCGTIEMLSDV